MTTIVTFRTQKDKRKDQIVRKLEACLQLARQGRLQSLLVVTKLEAGGVQTGCVGDWLEVLGTLRVAERQVLDSAEETEPEEP